MGRFGKKDKGKEKVRDKGKEKVAGPKKVEIISSKEFWESVVKAAPKTKKELRGRMEKHLQEISCLLNQYHNSPRFLVKPRQENLIDIITKCSALGAAYDLNKKDTKIVKICKMLLVSCISRLTYENSKAHLLGGKLATPPGQRGLSRKYRVEQLNKPGRAAIHTDNFPRHGDPSAPFSNEPAFVFTGNEEMDFYALKKWIKLTGTKANLVYLDEEQRKPYKLSFHEKVIYRNGGPFTTPDASSRPEYLRQSLIAAYAASPIGEFYCMWQAETEKGMRLNHSSFMSGRPVMCAGVLEVRFGKLLTISNNSGHYKPSIEDLQAACQAILMSGYIVDDEHCMALVYDGKGKRFPGFEGTEFYNEILGGPVFPVPFREFEKHGIAAVKSRYGARPSGRARRGNFLGSARGTPVHRLRDG